MPGKTPEFEMGRMPIWCHHHCGKIELVAVGTCDDFLVLQGSATELLIIKKGADWLVRWAVVQSPTDQTIGQVTFTKQELEIAFGLLDRERISKTAEWLIDRYGGTSAEQGKFIRFENYLNIPCPGTGNDGDPNISIEITEKIKKALLKILYECR